MDTMLKVLYTRLKQGFRTMEYPDSPPTLPARMRGRPALDDSKCDPACRRCFEACPTGAIFRDEQGLAIDLGGCLMCGECSRVCQNNAVEFTGNHVLASSSRENLILRGRDFKPAQSLEKPLRDLLSKSLKIRQVSAGGCNACEADINVLGTLAFDIGRFGIQVVASPRHADALMVTGPVTQNMLHALEKTYAAIPKPKIVIAVGACAISGGPFKDHAEVNNGVSSVLPVDLYIPGCPPHPITILDGLLRILGRI